MKTPLRIAIPLTLASSFLIGAVAAPLVGSARATTCSGGDVEAWRVELVDVSIEGTLDQAVETIAWPASATIVGGWYEPSLHNGPNFVIRLDEVE